MNGLSNLESWLSDSTKNRHYFHSAVSRSGYNSEWNEAFRILSNALPYVVTREDYFRWRAAWRATYNKLSDESRLMKGLRRPLIEPNQDGWVHHAHLRAASSTIAEWNQEGVRYLRPLARALLELRAESFEHADKQYKIQQSMLEIA